MLTICYKNLMDLNLIGVFVHELFKCKKAILTLYKFLTRKLLLTFSQKYHRSPEAYRVKSAKYYRYK